MAAKRKNRMLLYLGGAVILLIIIALVFKKNSGHGIKVETSKVEKRTIVQKVSASGKIYPEIEVVIIPEISGEITTLYVEEGDSVQKGDALVDINPDIYQNAVERAHAAVLSAKAALANAKAREAEAVARFENAKLDFKRNKTLYEQKVISDADIESAETAFKVAEAQLTSATESTNGAKYNVQSSLATYGEAKNNLSKTTVFSPMSGVVTALNVEEGKVVGGIAQFAATEMMRVSNLNEMEAQVEVSENDILNISLHDTAEIEVEAYPDRIFKGIVSEISSSAISSSGLSNDQATNFTVKIRILPESYKDLLSEMKTQHIFLPGMSSSVEIISDRAANVLSVPIECITVREDLSEQDSVKNEKNENQEFVFINDHGKAAIKEVMSGIQDDEFIEILEGLEEDEELISGPYTSIHKLLKPGDPVTSTTKERVEAD